MSATDELRLLLDERGVEWRDNNGDIEFCGADGRMLVAWDAGADREHMLTLTRLMPIQAVAMTLGRERQCRLVDRYGDWYCTNCGEMVGTCDSTSELHVDGNTVEHLWRYCPYCGAKVIASVVEL